MRKILEKLLARKLKALEVLQSEIAQIRSTLETL